MPAPRMTLLKRTISAFLDDDCPRMAAALSYYTVFSLPALLLIVMLVAGMFVEPADIRGRLLSQVRLLIGPGAADQIGEILRRADRPGRGSLTIMVPSIAALLFAATGAFAQLQGAMNRVWQVEPDPDRGGVRNFLLKRAASFLMILGVALLLLASIVASAALTAFGDFVVALLPADMSAPALRALGYAASFLVAVLLFATLFQVLPDARVEWRDAWVGATATALLFVLGNYLLGLYLGSSDPGSAFGAAGSLALIMIWTYYTAMTFFLGAELTQAFALRRGARIRPSGGAVRVVLERHVIRDEAPHRPPGDAGGSAPRDAGAGGPPPTAGGERVDDSAMTRTEQVPQVVLPGGERIPQLGLGTWLLEGEACERAVAAALDMGYRHVDTAEGYRNEREVGRAIRGHDREDLWITSKVWRQHLRPADLRRSCEKSLDRLKTPYLDLYLIHWPNRDISIGETVAEFERLRDDGLIRSWGVSNFTPAHMREVTAIGRPATNQVELHPYFNQRELVRVCRELGVPITAYSPIARGRILDDEVLRDIARAHGRTVAQIALRWSLQHGYIVIPKSSREEHLRSNLDVFDFELTPEEMTRIDALPQGERIVDGEWSEFDRV